MLDTVIPIFGTGDHAARGKRWYAVNTKYCQCQYSKCHRIGPQDSCILNRSILEHDSLPRAPNILVFISLDDDSMENSVPVFFQTNYRLSSHVIYISCISRDNHICYEGESGIHIQNTTNYISPVLSNPINFSMLF